MLPWQWSLKEQLFEDLCLCGGIHQESRIHTLTCAGRGCRAPAERAPPQPHCLRWQQLLLQLPAWGLPLALLQMPWPPVCSWRTSHLISCLALQLFSQRGLNDAHGETPGLRPVDLCWAGSTELCLLPADRGLDTLMLTSGAMSSGWKRREGV